MPSKSTWPADKVERRKTSALVPYAKNARTHSDTQVAQIAASISEWGWTVPILVDEKGVIIAGHGRVLAAKKLGLEDVPVMTATGWSDEQKRAYILADNQLTLNGGWDTALLGDELRDLGAAGFDLDLIGFGDGLAGLLVDRNAGLTDPDEAPSAPVDPITVKGDLWVCGDHRVLCGDSLQIDAVDRLLGGNVPDLANCDPPYGIKAVKGATDGGSKPFGKSGGGGMTRFGRVHGRAKNAIIEANLYAEIIGDDSTETAIQCYGILTGLAVPAVVLWGGNYFAEALPPSRCWLVWDKETNGNFADAELAWTNQDAVVRLLRHQWSGLIKASERGEKRVHPTQKPVALAEWVIDTVAPKAKTMIDLFLGSGSSLIACERKGVACFGMELSEAYCDVIVRRWQGFTGASATLEGDGRTFDEIAALRLPDAA